MYLTKTKYKHPQANLTENRNKTIKQILSKIVADNPNQWPKYLQIALFSYNNTVNKSTGFSPGYLFYGRKMRNAHDVHFGTTTTHYFRNEAHYANSLYWELRQVYKVVSENLQSQQERCKRYYDKKAHRTHYSEGDCVAIYLPLLTKERPNNEFKTRLRVLFQIERVISDQNYLVVELAIGKKKVIHHDLMRLIPHSLVQKIAKKYHIQSMI